MNPPDIYTPKTFSFKKFDTESNKNVIYVYQNYQHYRKNCMGVAEYYKEKRKEMNLRGMDWRDKELIKSIHEQKQKDEEYQKQKQVRYHKYILRARTQKK